MQKPTVGQKSKCPFSANCKLSLFWPFTNSARWTLKPKPAHVSASLAYLLSNREQNMKPFEYIAALLIGVFVYCMFVVLLAI